MILVDTSVWIDFLNGMDSPERRTLHRLIADAEDMSITGIILTEILQGIREDKDFRMTRDYLMAFPLFEPKGATYLNAAGIYRQCCKQGKTVRSTVDCIIAAILPENDFTILHKDHDFDVIRECVGLKVL